MKYQKVIIFFALVLGLFFFSPLPGIRFNILVVADTTTHEGDIVIGDAETFIIQDCEFIQKGNVVVKDTAKLIIKNAFLEFNATYPYQYNVTISDSAELIVNSGGITSINPPYPQFELYMMQKANATLNDAYINGRIWSYDSSLITGNKVQLFGSLQSHNNTVSLFENSYFIYGGPMVARDHSRLDVKKSSAGQIRILCSDYASITLEDVYSSVIELMFKGNSIATLPSLSGFCQYWNVHENATITEVEWNVTLKKTRVDSWDLYLYDSVSVTVQDCENLQAYCFGTSRLTLERTTLFKNHFHDRSSGIIRKTIVKFYSLLLTDNSSVLVRDSEIGWVRARNYASVTIKNSIKNPTIDYVTYSELTDYALAVFENVTIDVAYFYKHSSGVITNCHEIKSIIVLENASVLFQNGALSGSLTLWGYSKATIYGSIIRRLHAQDFAIIHCLDSELGALTKIYDNATLYFDYYLTVNVELNDLPLENATVKIFYAHNQRFLRGTTNAQGEVRFTLTGKVIRSEGTQTFTYKTEVHYCKLVKELNITPYWHKTVTVQLFDLISPEVGELTWSPTDPSAEDNVTVKVSASDEQTYIFNVTLWFKTEEKWHPLNMTFKEGFWTAIIPKQASDTVVEFYVETYDIVGNKAETETYNYTVRADTVKTVAFPMWEQWWLWATIVAAGACIAVTLVLWKRREAKAKNKAIL
jgi:hypothetical protein